jgi:DNA-directed RNA polymerase alpha subunit
LASVSGPPWWRGTTWAENWQRAGEAGGIRHLGLDHLTRRPLIHAGMVHVGDLARRVEDGTLLAVPGIGAKRAEEIRAAVNQSPTCVL